MIAERDLTINVLGNVTRTITIPENLEVLQGDAPRPVNRHAFRIINQVDGDKRIVWDRNSLVEIQEAKDLFDKLVSQGLVPYAVSPSGKKSPHVMREFDAGAEEVIFAPIAMLVGG